VQLRSGGRFYCSRFQAPRATWSLDPSCMSAAGGAANTGFGPPVHELTADLRIEWGKFGKYSLEMDLLSKAASGSAVGNPDSWRKMAFKRPFSTAELALFDSEWLFMHAGGEFKVEFRADCVNQFHCPSFPAQSHWRFLDESATPTVHISWGKYGEYEVKLAEDGATFEGALKGTPSSWRRGKRLGACSIASVQEQSH